MISKYLYLPTYPDSRHSMSMNFAMQSLNVFPLFLLFITLFLLFQQTISQKLKGFHFNKGRKQLWSLPEHEVNKNDSWFFDFEEYGNCLRLDVSPFKLPRRFTLCYKQNHDITDTFTFLSLLSTKSGKSAIEELKSNP